MGRMENVVVEKRKEGQNRQETGGREGEEEREDEINQGKEVSPHRHRATPLCHP